ncbi:MAG TPA: diphosphomevalonate decarboxylase [Nevskiaceae bacterium]|nr:diphosphomevalonate decarboxylase [Nevskiaceae bacterium]
MKKLYKATAKSPANIAFIKYWGKKDPQINLPFNNSISMNLSHCFTVTTVEFVKRFRKDRVFINDKEVFAGKKDRVVNILNIVRKMAKIDWKARVVSQNNFPADAGIASSASGFSALALAASKAAGLDLTLKELSILARFGSGSACRSVIDGFAEWKKGKDSQTSFAVQLAPLEFWNLIDIVVVMAKEKKKISTTEGHAAALTSPHYKTRLKELKARIKNLRETFLKKQFKKFGELIEEETISLHIIAMTSNPPIFYWDKGTMVVINELYNWREEGFLAYFTIDAGPNVHVICRQKDERKVNQRLKELPEVLFTIVNHPAKGSRLVEKHLF